MYIKAIAAAAALVMTVPAAVHAQAANQSIVSIYRAAPGHQEMLVQWLAERDRIGAVAGVAPSQLYVHQDGDSWDYVTISPITTPAQDDAMEAEAARLGLTTGPRVGLELRKHTSTHTDTIAAGPTTAAEYAARIRAK